MQDDKPGMTVAFWCFTVMALIALLVVPAKAGYELGLKMGYEDAPPREVYPSIRKGWPPSGTPLLLYWVGEDGTVWAESAMRTDFAGILPFSLTGKPVEATQLEGWVAWTDLNPALLRIDQ